ncbi:MAG TPA: excinuclease ABC subunit UvrA [Candidatus Dormibacteraeota bacterium]|nr:excinuclease ABC subunit UvrA [Candidatus Dormibacteraeota bacterium]
MATLIASSSAGVSQASDAISVRGARVHNLKNISFDIPANAITVVTGVSGSGKSSLAFDTLYAEGQRRYIESLSAYARQFLERIERPDIDEISGIAPAIAIRQKNTTRNPRSTIATATEIYDYLRLLFARAGRTYCYQCGEPVMRDSIDQIADRVLDGSPGRRFLVLYRLHFPAEPAPRRKGRPKRRQVGEAVRRALLELQKRGFTRLWQSGRVFELGEPETLLAMNFDEPVYALVDRLVVAPESRSRLVDSMELAYREGRGEAVVQFVDGDQEKLLFSERFECRRCGLVYQEPEPILFSFNSPYGACPRCQGFGNTVDYDPDLVVPDKALSLGDGAIEPWTKPRYRFLAAELRRFAKANGIPLDVPFHQLSAKDREAVFRGDRAQGFHGVQGFFGWLERKKYKLHVRVFLSRYRGYAVCSECQGTRLRPEARAVKIGGLSIADVCRMSVERAREYFASLALTRTQAEIAQRVLEEIRQRLGFLGEVGLEYLTLDRLTSTLSGGEAQRIQLATSLGSQLVGALYVLDEPSVGLHPRDTQRLVGILKSLRDLGNTILVVEHDRDTIAAADHILDLGPGAGEQGGHLLYAGPLDGIGSEKRSLTGRYLSGELQIQVPPHRRQPGRRSLMVKGARAHNLKNIDVRLPLGLMLAITGVSGSGKSTLVHNVLYDGLKAQRLAGAAGDACDRIEGDHFVQDVVLVDQSPIGRTPRSNPATYLKAFDAIRDVFARTPQARLRGYSPGTFSFNIPGGRCEACQGDGTVTVEMQFLADVELVCEECKGTRYKPEVLEVTYRGKNIHDVLQMTAREARSFFAAAPKVVQRLRILEEVGLGYLRLGQSATTLSGGEAQRLKLGAHLTRPVNEGVLYILDEPTTGLHFDDIQKLLAAFHRLLDAGASVIVIEHNLDVVKSADWVIDLGPEGGENGGHIVAAGPPEVIAQSRQSHTGHYLAPLLAGSTKVEAAE